MTVKGLDQISQRDRETILSHDVLDALADFIGSDPFGQYLSEFVDNTQQNIDRIGMAVAAGDDDRIRHLAHKLKGSSGNIGALKLAWNCVQLEAGTVEQLPEELLRKQFEDLQSAFRDTRTAIQSYVQQLSITHSGTA